MWQFNAEPNLCTNVTEPHLPSGIPLSRARFLNDANTSRIKIPSTAVRRSESKATRYRNEYGSESTHCRTGTAGITLSTRCAAVSPILLPPHDGQKARPPLQENASNRSLRHVSQCR